MAEQVILIDDIDGTEADVTVPFSIDGKAYEIDLSKANAAKLRRALDKYVQAARPVAATTKGRSGGAKRDYDLAALREWAKSKRIKLPARGRIPGDVIDRYKKEGGK